MDTLKKWGKWILGAVMFVGALLFAFASRSKSGGTPKPDILTPDAVVVKQQEEKLETNKVTIEKGQKDAVAQAKPVTPTNSKDIDEAIDTWNKM